MEDKRVKIYINVQNYDNTQVLYGLSEGVRTFEEAEAELARAKRVIERIIEEEPIE